MKTQWTQVPMYVRGTNVISRLLKFLLVSTRCF